MFFWFFYNVLPDLFMSGFIQNWLWGLPFISLLSRIASVLKGLSEGTHKSVWLFVGWGRQCTTRTELNTNKCSVSREEHWYYNGGNTYTGYLPPTVRVRETFCNPLVLPTTIMEILVVQNAKVLVQTIWFNLYEVKWRWLATDTKVNNCFSIY